MSLETHWQMEHMDWEPLKAVVGEQGLADWMWMHTCDSPASGTPVHFYKHIDSRSYLRLDAYGRVYGEKPDGEPVALPGCGGATLLLQLVQACAHVGPGVPPALTLPEAAREECAVADLAVLDALVQRLSREYRTVIETFESSGQAEVGRPRR